MKKLLSFSISILFLLVLSGCHEGVFHWVTPEPGSAVVTSEPEVIPAEETGEVAPDPTPEPPCLVIKGNISRSGEKIYHMPGGANYNQVKIDESAGEMFFCSEEEAVAAGWRKASH